MNEKIEEMAKVIESELKVYFGAGDVVAPEDYPYQARGIAESLAKKGYQKESDTAREILIEFLDFVNGWFEGVKNNDFCVEFNRISQDLFEKYNRGGR